MVDRSGANMRKIKCYWCGGVGTIWTGEECLKCGGTGKTVAIKKKFKKKAVKKIYKKKKKTKNVLEVPVPKAQVKKMKRRRVIHDTQIENGCNA